MDKIPVSMQYQQQTSKNAWDKVKNYAKNATETVAPYIPTYYVGYGIGSIRSDLQDSNGYINSIKNVVSYNNQYNPMKVNDKYKHALINCLMAQNGKKAEKVAQIISGLKENYDVFMNKNTSQASDEDMEANIYGRKSGRSNQRESCYELISKKYKP